MRNTPVGFLATIGLLTAMISGCAFNPPALDEKVFNQADNLESLLVSQIKDLHLDEQGRWYGKKQYYDDFGYSDLKKPRTYAEQYCLHQGGDFIALTALPAPIPRGTTTRNAKSDLPRNLGNMFGSFQCSVNGDPRWYLDVRYANVQISPTLSESLRGQYQATLYFKYSEPYQYAEAKRTEELRQIQNEIQRVEAKAAREALQNRELARLKQERLVNKKVGARVCVNRSTHNSLMGDVRLYGTVEQVQGERIKVFVEGAHYTRVTSRAPSDFSQHWAWIDYWEFFPCTFTSY